MKKKLHIHPVRKHHLIITAKMTFWFGTGVVLGLFFFVSFLFLFFQRIYGNSVYPGISIGQVNFGGRTKSAVLQYFESKNARIADTHVTFIQGDFIATASAKSLGIGYNSKLLATQAFSIGRSSDMVSNISLVFGAYIAGVRLTPSYTYDDDKLMHILSPIITASRIVPVDALFSFENGRVTTFRLASNGQEVDTDMVRQTIIAKLPAIITPEQTQSIIVQVPLRTVKPKIASNDANTYGIQELIGSGTSLYAHSIPSRMYNVALAASRINGVLIAPNEVFSFDKALGDVSSFTGYQQAYVIANGKTVLGDGGGVCQVSTTFFRALLNAGLPIVERTAHAYRVGYYEENSPPGFDATVYVPSVDLKFLNDTGSYILVQESIDPSQPRLTFNLYGKKDGRQVTITQPVVKNQIPAPPPSYQDDPTLPKGVVKQIDFSADGATVMFARTVVRNNKVIINDTYTSVYQPWQAVFLRGTQ